MFRPFRFAILIGLLALGAVGLTAAIDAPASAPDSPTEAGR